MAAPDTSLTAFEKHVTAVRTKATASKYVSGARQFLDIVRFNGFGSFAELPRNILAQYVQVMVEQGYSASSIHVYLAGVKRYLAWVRDQGVEVTDFSKPDTPVVRHVIRDVLNPEQLKVYFRYADDLEEPSRTATMLLPCTGLRATELATLELKALRAVRIPMVDGSVKRTIALRVTGKGDKMRTVPLLEEGVPIITGYLSGFRRKLPGPYVFPGALNKTNKHGKRSMSARTLRDAVVQIREPLGMKFTPHTMRRTYLTSLYRRGVDPVTIAKIAGHANIQTLFKHYLMLDEHDVVKAVHEHNDGRLI